MRPDFDDASPTVLPAQFCIIRLSYSCLIIRKFLYLLLFILPKLLQTGVPALRDNIVTGFIPARDAIGPSSLMIRRNCWAATIQWCRDGAKLRADPIMIDADLTDIMAKI